MGEYVAIETDQVKKVEAQRILGDIFRVAGDWITRLPSIKKFGN